MLPEAHIQQPLQTLAETTIKFCVDFPKESLQQIIEGLLEHFFPCGSTEYCDADVRWFLNLFEKEYFEQVFFSQESGVRLLKFYMSRVLLNLPVDEECKNPLAFFHDKACAVFLFVHKYIYKYIFFYI